MTTFLLFNLENRPFAIPLERVLRVERMVAITPLPGGSPFRPGVINVHGQTVPVLDLRPLHGMATRPARLSDQLLLACTSKEMVALHIDSAEEVFTLPPEETVSSEGTIAVSGEIVPVHDPEELLQKVGEGEAP